MRKSRRRIPRYVVLEWTGAVCVWTFIVSLIVVCVWTFIVSLIVVWGLRTAGLWG